MEILHLPNFAWYLIAGAIGAFCLSMGRFAGQKFIPHFPDMPLLLSRLVDWGKPEPKSAARIMGTYFHLGTGALWGLAFGLLTEKQFFFVEFTAVSGMLFSIIPWLFLMIILFPILREGFFGLKISPHQWFFALLLHLLYGAVMGILLSLFIPVKF